TQGCHFDDDPGFIVSKCHTSVSETPHFIRTNATLCMLQSVVFALMKYGICSDEVWRSERYSGLLTIFRKRLFMHISLVFSINRLFFKE
ncbi:MAG: hypothetical protein EGR83_15645, partial [Bacteroides cellulosilyticus]|nr:hypothetical protein [Bacteroides cellulosilyticus]